MGQITNVWVDDEFRRMGIATGIVQYLLEQYRNDVGMVCLNSLEEAIHMYLKMGFVLKGN